MLGSDRTARGKIRTERYSICFVEDVARCLEYLHGAKSIQRLGEGGGLR